MSNKRGESPFDEPISVLTSADPYSVALKSGAIWEPSGAGEGRLAVPVLNGVISVGYPDMTIDAPPGLNSFSLKLLTVIYLSKSDGARPTGDWVSFRELHGGRFYEPVVQKSVEARLAQSFADDTGRFREAAVSLAGKADKFGDASYAFSLFPNVLLCFVIWKSDEEFPARAQVLFDSNCTHHLGAFDMRMGAQEVSNRLIGFSKSQTAG